MNPLRAALIAELIDGLADDPVALERLRDLLGVSDPTRSPYLTAGEAAAYLKAPVSRVRKLTSTGALPVTRDGRRTLYARSALDQFLADGGGRSI